MSNSVWQQARLRYEQGLGPEDKKLFQDAFNVNCTLNDVLDTATTAKPSLKWKERLDTVIEPLKNIAPIFDVISQINSLIGCSIWGPLKLFIQVAQKHSEALDQLIFVIELLVESTKRFVVYEKLHETVPLVREVLQSFYFDLIDFCARAVRFFKRKTIVNMTRNTFKSFDADFHEIVANLKRHADAVDPTAVMAEMEKAGYEREAQDLFRKQWTIDSKKAEDERQIQAIERQAQELERNEQDTFRKLSQLHITQSDSERSKQEVERDTQDHERNIQDKFRQASELHITDTKREFQAQANRQQMADLHRKEQEMSQKVHQWLNPNNFRDEQTKRQKDKVPGTCVWLHQHATFRSWLQKSDSHSLLLIHGKPGCGKSMLASSVVHYLQQENYTVIYFFFNSKSKDTTSDPAESSSLLKALLIQLISIDHTLESIIHSELQKPGSSPSYETLIPLFCSVVERCSKPIFCMIDALDECNDRKRLLTDILDLVNVTREFRICITSRLLADIDELVTLDTMDNESDDENDDEDDDESISSSDTHGNVGVQEEGIPTVQKIMIKDTDVSRDIKVFVKTQVTKQLLQLKRHKTLQQKVISVLVEKCQGMFLWAQLMVEELKLASTPSMLESRLERLPKGLYDLYQSILFRIHYDTEAQTPKDLERLSRCRKILKWVIIARTALTITDISIAITLKDSITKIDEEHISFNPREEIIGLCGPLLEIREDDTVHIVHSTVREYLLEHKPGARPDSFKNSFEFRSPRLHADIANATLSLLLLPEILSYYNETYNGYTKEDVGEKLLPETLIHYAVGNWHHHCIHSGAGTKAKVIYNKINDYLCSDNSFIWAKFLKENEFVSNWIHLETQLDEWAKKIDLFTNSYTTFRTMIERIFSKLLETNSKRFGPEDEVVVSALSCLSSCYYLHGRFLEAEKLQMRVLEARMKVLGDKHLDTLIAMTNLAVTYSNQGRWTDAQKLEEQVLVGRKKTLGDTHPDTLTAMTNLARVYSGQGRWTDAQKLQEEVFSASKEILGDKHPDTLIVMAHLAGTYSYQGRWTDAQKLEEQALTASKEILGDKHLDTLMFTANLAETYRNQGRWADAQELQEQVLAARKEILGDKHPDVLKAMAKLAQTYSNRGRWTDAQELQEQVLVARKEILGDTHPDTLTATGNLAFTYGTLGRWEQAQELEVDVLAKRRAKLGDTHPHTILSIQNLAYTYTKLNRLGEARILEEELEELQKLNSVDSSEGNNRKESKGEK